MNEPLTNSPPGISFSGKTYNKHPQWYNLPLRLSEEQFDNPLLVLDDFFQGYHLNETREILWQWLTAVLSSQSSISSEPLERSNHIYFYEKLEELIEAAFIMKTSQLKGQDSISKNNNSSTLSSHLETTEYPDTYLNKEKQLIEYVQDDPIYVITEVFEKESLAFLRDQLRDWLHVALAADSSIYEDGEQRRQLLSFQDQLLILMESLFVISTQNSIDAGMEKKYLAGEKPTALTNDQLANPRQVVIGFFEKFPMVYIIRELNDWLEAGICYAGDYPPNMSELQVLYVYRNVLCLIKAANRISTIK